MCVIFTKQQSYYKQGDKVSCVRIREGINITCDYPTLEYIYLNFRHQYRLSVCKHGQYYRCYFGGKLKLDIPNNIEEFIKENEK